VGRSAGAPARSRRIGRDDAAPHEAADRAARRRADDGGPARASTQRWYRAPDTAPSEMAEPPARELGSPRLGRGDTGTRSLRWHRAPDLADVESAVSVRRREDAPAPSETVVPMRAPREIAPPPDRIPRVTTQLATPRAGSAPARTPWRRDAAPADHETVAVSPFALLGDAAATSTLARPRTPMPPVHAPFELPRAPGSPARDRRATPVMPEPAGWDPVAVQRGVSTESHASPMEMCAAMWPRLPDEDDDAGGDQRASPWRSPEERLWPQLPVDELMPVEEPAQGDPGRDDRLRREQRGMRWSERRS
jgi:hypothetical protein